MVWCYGITWYYHTELWYGAMEVYGTELWYGYGSGWYYGPELWYGAMKTDVLCTGRGGGTVLHLLRGCRVRGLFTGC
eukprot:555926-Rhodomonas_salina.3